MGAQLVPHSRRLIASKAERCQGSRRVFINHLVEPTHPERMRVDVWRAAKDGCAMGGAKVRPPAIAISGPVRRAFHGEGFLAS